MNNQSTKNIILIIVVALIVISIFYLQAHKPPTIAPGQADILIENLPASTDASSSSSGSVTPERRMTQEEKAKQYSRAKELVDPSGFINTNAFKISDLVGKKVILVDFWTYSCINCQRTTPYLNAWYKKYKDFGLEIVGVHTPEFGFEKDYNNVSKAVKAAGIQYPVVLDNNNGTWNAYQNNYWPHKYLVDIDGFITYDHIGEGNYDGTERLIQKALEERKQALKLNIQIPTGIVSPADVISMDDAKVQSPEVYFGTRRNVYLESGYPSSPELNKLYLDGDWKFDPEFAVNNQAGAKIKFKYNAKNVYMVASAAAPVTIKIFQDGNLVKSLTVSDNKLYTLINGTSYGTHILEIEVDGKGLQAYTFTFG